MNNIYMLIMQMEPHRWEDAPAEESLGLSAGRMEALIQREPENVRGLIQEGLDFYANVFDGVWGQAVECAKMMVVACSQRTWRDNNIDLVCAQHQAKTLYGQALSTPTKENTEQLAILATDLATQAFEHNTNNTLTHALNTPYTHWDTTATKTTLTLDTGEHVTLTLTPAQKSVVDTARAVASGNINTTLWHLGQHTFNTTGQPHQDVQSALRAAVEGVHVWRPSGSLSEEVGMLLEMYAWAISRQQYDGLLEYKIIQQAIEWCATRITEDCASLNHPPSRPRHLHPGGTREHQQEHK